MSDDHDTWVSRRAVAWAIDEAPVPADLLATLIVVVRRCDEQGRGSYQSMKTLAEKTGKSEDQARRDLKRLRELGLLTLGDQSLPAKHGVPAGQRPTVYDAALRLKGAKPRKGSKNPTGEKKTETPCMDATPCIHATPGMDAPLTPCMDAGGPLASMQAEEFLEQSLKQTPPTPPSPKGGTQAKQRTSATKEHPRFAEWYATYPVHKARGAAVKAYAQAAKKTTPAVLLAAAQRYRHDPQVARGYGKHPATWLNQECWLDEPAPLQATGTDSTYGHGPRARVNDHDWSQGGPTV